MKSFFKTFRTAANRFGKLNLLATLSLFAGICFAQTAFGQTETDPCIEYQYPFTGTPATTLCQQYGEIVCDIEVGAGTLITQSSQIGSSYTGNVCIKGNFTINNSFSFVNCVVKIDPGVTIFLQSPNSPFISRIFTVDNSKLFACDDLWNGIVMSNNTTVSTKNHTRIEDAEVAIKAQDTQFTNLLISSTTFNRNRVGISLEAASTISKGPFFYIFEDNTFECTAPLNGTTDEITSIGVNIRNVFNAFLDNPSSTNNEFSNIVNGIVATGNMTDVTIYGFVFEGVRNKGIDFSGRKLRVFGSTFEHIQRHGVHFHEALEMELRNNEFYIRETEADLIWRYMVQVEDPLPGNSINIGNGNYFYTEGQLFNWVEWAIQLRTSGVSEMNASIHNCTFDLYNSSLEIAGDASRAISLEGNFSDASDVDIEFNNINTNTFILTYNYGVYCDYGTKNNVHVIGNDFTGGGGHIWMRGSDGLGNDFTSNEHFQSSDFATGMFAMDFQNLNVCSNTNHAASNVSYLFNGANNGMTFSGNVTFGGVQHSLWVAGTDPVIGQQFQAGNEWYPGLRPAGGGFFFIDHPFLQHASSNLNLIEMSKFFVHTPQSVFNQNTGQYDFFSEFHPAFIDPDVFPLEDAFFQFLNGTPNTGCAVQLTNPDEGDKRIADGAFGSLVSSPALAWDAQRHLYKKLLSNPGYEGTYGGFYTFLQANATSNVGKFYQLEQKINEAAAMQASLVAQVEAARASIADDDEDVSALLAGNNYTDEALHALLEGRHGSAQEISDALAQFALYRAGKLTEAQAILQTIAPAGNHEAYRKTVLQVFLQAHLYQNGLYSEAQAAQLKDIARLCSEEGGMAVYVAQGLLSECDLADIREAIDACNPDLEGGERSGGTPHSFMTLGGEPEKGFFYYPNPSQGKIVLSNQKQVEGTMEIFTATGRLLGARPVAQGESFLELGLPSGIYFVKIAFGNGDIVSD